MRVILLSLMMVCLFGFHVNACWPTPTSGCEGNAEVRTEYIGSGGMTSQTLHGMMSVNQTDVLPKKVSELTYYGSIPGDAKVTIELEGNCCWKFYER